MAERVLIRGGHVVTMDPALGEIPAGDVLIEADRIAAVAPQIETADARVVDARNAVVMPGFVDTHRHTWQTQMRGICADWTLADYFFGIRLTICPAYAAEDVHIGNRLGGLEALDAGVTTLLDFSHCNNTPEHADAAIDGLRAAGIRALHCYGFFAAARDNPAFPSHEHRRADFARVARSHSTADGLVRIGAALSEIGVLPWNDTVAEIRAARDVSARMVLHTGCVWGSVVTLGVKEMHRHRLLGPDQVHVHCNTLDGEEWSMLADAGAKVSISPETELNMGMGRLAFEGCRGHGIRPTLSCDIVSLNSGDLFTQMRLALAWQRFADNEPVNRAGGMPQSLSYAARDALRWATLDGAEACGLDSRIGSLTPGKQADVIVVGGPDSLALRPRADPAASVVFQAGARDVREVFVAGKHVKRDGRLVGVDVARLLDEAEHSAARILERARASSPELPPRRPGGFDATEALARAHLAEAKAR